MRKTTYLFVSVGFLILLACTNQKSGQSEIAKTLVPDSIYIKKGDQLVVKTFDTLRNSLLDAISHKGLDGAVVFCNERAYRITSTFADSVSIRRTALQYRNPSNKPDSIETIVLNEMKADIQSGKISSSKIIRDKISGTLHYFKPILSQPMCLNCHGIPGKEIKEPTLSKIKAIYPGDVAVNFKVGDLRGAWHIVFKEVTTSK